jgi:PAS domain-containing protein
MSQEHDAEAHHSSYSGSMVNTMRHYPHHASYATSVLIGVPSAMGFSHWHDYPYVHVVEGSSDGRHSYLDRQTNNALDPTTDAKNRQKRAANRKSAQQSRQRKKLYIEELTSEYSELKQMADILAVMSDLVLMLNEQGCILFVSESARRVLHHSPGALKGRCILSLLAPESAIRFREVLATAAQVTAHAARRPARSEEGPFYTLDRTMLSFVRGDGAALPLEVSGTAQVCEGGHLEFVCAARLKTPMPAGAVAFSSSNATTSSNGGGRSSGSSTSGSTLGGTDSDDGSNSEMRTEAGAETRNETGTEVSAEARADTGASLVH